MRSWLLIPALLLAASCDRSTDDIPQADVAPDVVGQEVAPPDCHPSQRDLEGKCCPAGQFYAFATAQCLAIGPLECAAVLPASPESCVPRWCADWRDDDGVACPSGDDNCLPVGRTCTATELASGGGCPAGQWPSPPTGACVPAQAAPPADRKSVV